MTSLTLRQATLRDLPSITNVTVAGMPDDPMFEYLYKHRKEYPEDNWFFWHQTFKAMLFEPKLTILVAVQQREKQAVEEEAKERVVAFAVWERNVPKQKGLLGRLGVWEEWSWWDELHRLLTRIENWAIGNQFPRRDSDPNRLEAFFKRSKAIRAKYWEGLYPDNWCLVLLATHPDFRGQGAGTLLTQWGIDKGCDVGVVGSPMGVLLYKKLGFKVKETRRLQVEGEEEFVDGVVMVREKAAKLDG